MKMDHCFHNNGNLIFKIHALGDDSQLSRIRRRFKEQSGLIYHRKTSLPSVSDWLWNAFRNNEDRPPSTTFFSLLPYFLFIWPPSLRWAFIYCLIYRHPLPRCEYILSPSNLILKYGDAGRNSLGLGRWRFMQRSLKPWPGNYQYAISMGRLSPLILMNFRFICLASCLCDMYREGENEEQ